MATAKKAAKAKASARKAVKRVAARQPYHVVYAPTLKSSISDEAIAAAVRAVVYG
jgi:hypothetical protein